MYAVVSSGGKQYKVQKDEILRVEKISGDIGVPVSFDKVLMFSDGENVNIGQPVLENVSVNGHIVEQDKAKKIIVTPITVINNVCPSSFNRNLKRVTSERPLFRS